MARSGRAIFLTAVVVAALVISPITAPAPPNLVHKISEKNWKVLEDLTAPEAHFCRAGNSR
jgi:hypothetical protein